MVRERMWPAAPGRTARAAAMIAAAWLADHPAAAQTTGWETPCGRGVRPAPPPRPTPPPLRPVDVRPRAVGEQQLTSDQGAMSCPFAAPESIPGIWQGLYVGGHLGWGSGHARTTASGERLDLSGAVIGVHGGYNWQSQALVFGVEADLDATDSKGSRVFTSGQWTAASSIWMASLRGRVGVAFDKILVFGTLGGALHDVDVTIADAATISRSNQVLYGWVVGGGVDWRLTEAWSLRLEALHYEFNSQRLGISATSFDTHMTTVRAGMTFRFW